MGKKLATFQQFYPKTLTYQFFIHFFLLTAIDTSRFVPKYDWNYCSPVRLAQLFWSDNGAIAPRWHWCECSQKTLAQMFPSDTGIILHEWQEYNYSQARLPIVPKWDWSHCSHVTLEQLIPKETGTLFIRENDTIVPK